MTFEKAFVICSPYTLTCQKRMKQLWESVSYVAKSGIPGDLVETGVWKGGNIMLMALACKEFGLKRQIWAYDTFEGMPEAGEYDLRHDGKEPDFSARNNLEVSLYDVRQNVAQARYRNIRYVKGKVEETIPEEMPGQIAILRTDTDFYSSTHHTLVHLYPAISEEGIFINDDYYHFKGARKACDEYFGDEDFKRIGDSNAIWRMK